MIQLLTARLCIGTGFPTAKRQLNNPNSTRMYQFQISSFNDHQIQPKNTDHLMNIPQSSSHICSSPRLVRAWGHRKSGATSSPTLYNIRAPRTLLLHISDSPPSTSETHQNDYPSNNNTIVRSINGHKSSESVKTCSASIARHYPRVREPSESLQGELFCPKRIYVPFSHKQ